jgi:hypothetical protein
MNSTLAQRVAKIREDFEKIPPATIQQNRQFFDDVWNLCGAVMDAEENSTGQFCTLRPAHVVSHFVTRTNSAFDLLGKVLLLLLPCHFDGTLVPCSRDEALLLCR